jgi:BMFP domain-containing protein YqiC
MATLSDSLDSVLCKIRQALPDDLEDLGRDLRKNLRARMNGALSRLDLVTREEFEAQRELATRLSERIEALTARLEEMGGRDKSETGEAPSRKTPRH